MERGRMCRELEQVVSSASESQLSSYTKVVSKKERFILKKKKRKGRTLCSTTLPEVEHQG